MTYDVLVPLETPYGETSWARIWCFWSDATKMGSSARPYGPCRSIIFPPQNCHNQSIGLAFRASPFVSFGAFARKYNPNVGSALWALFFECRKCTRRQFFALLMSASRSRTCCGRLRPRWVWYWIKRCLFNTFRHTSVTSSEWRGILGIKACHRFISFSDEFQPSPSL